MLKRRKTKGRKEMNGEVRRIDSRAGAFIPAIDSLSGMIEQANNLHNRETPPLAMIVCTICKHLAYSPVDNNECDNLLDGGLISRHCHLCGEATNWQDFEWHRPDWNKPLLYQTQQPDRV